MLDVHAVAFQLALDNQGNAPYNPNRRSYSIPQYRDHPCGALYVARIPDNNREYNRQDNSRAKNPVNEAPSVNYLLFQFVLKYTIKRFIIEESL